MHKKVFPHQITFCTRLMFDLVRVGKEWAGPVFPHPLKSKGYICIHDRVRLAVFFCRRLTICTTVSPHLITQPRLMFYLVRVEKKWVGPVFPHIQNYSSLDTYSCQYGEKVGQPSFSPALALNITDVEKYKVGNKLTWWGKTDWLIFSPREKND